MKKKKIASISAESCFVRRGGCDNFRKFKEQFASLFKSVEAQWQDSHPERHALVLLYDEDGNMAVYDSYSPGGFYDHDAKVERHRLMLAALLTHAEPGLAQALNLYMSCMVAEVPLKEIVKDEDINVPLPEWMPEIYHYAVKLINDDVRLKKIAVFDDNKTESHGKD